MTKLTGMHKSMWNLYRLEATIDLLVFAMTMVILFLIIGVFFVAFLVA